MSRSVTSVFKSAINARTTSEVFVLLVTIDEDSLDTPIRVSTDNNDSFLVDSETVNGTTSNGENYIFFPMDIILANDSEDRPPVVQISIENVSQEIIASIRGLSAPPSITMQIVLASDPDTVEATLSDFIMSSVDYDSMLITGTITKDHFYNEPFPGGQILPSNFPGCF